MQRMFVLATCLLISAVQGCIPAPRTVTHSSRINSTEASSTRSSATAPASTDLWKAEVIPPHASDATSSAPVKRIAITEFAVEFVTVRTRTPFDSQLAVKLPPWDPISGAFELIGFSRAETPFKLEARTALTTTLYHRFTAHLEQLGYTLIPQSDVHRSAGFDALTKGHLDGESADSSALDYFRLLSTDIGVINASTAQPAPGTRLADTGQSSSNRRASEMLVLQNTAADATLSLHVLVGCYQGRAAVEQGSRVRVMRADGQEMTMTSQRSLLSDKKVRSPGYFMPIVGMVERLNQDAFDRETEALLEPYLDPALQSATSDR